MGGDVGGDAPIDLGRAAKDPAELGRALKRAHHAWGLPPHTLSISTATTVEEGGKVVDDLSDHTTIELGAKDAFHALYTNSADYGREVTFLGGQLYLKPRYQKWHRRAPEAPDEPDQIDDDMAGAVFATWDLLAPGVELTDRGNVKRDENWMTSVPGVFTAGDMQRGQSLIVWAIAEGRSAARGVDRYLMGRSDLPAPLP